jgi:hypothetical protein
MTRENSLIRALVSWRQRVRAEARDATPRSVAEVAELEREHFWERVDAVSRWGFAAAIH